jgi:hypothetical protein
LHQPVQKLLPAFIEVTRRWLEPLDFGIKRLAFGLHAALTVADRVEAYNLLQSLLRHRVKFDPERSSDFVYQINHPTSSKTTGLNFNRLMKWSAMTVQMVQFELGQAPSAQSALIRLREFASTECDVNTPGDRQDPLDNAVLGAIYDELVNLAWENLEMGEIP